MDTLANNITIQPNTVPKIPASIIATGKILQFIAPPLATFRN